MFKHLCMLSRFPKYFKPKLDDISYPVFIKLICHKCSGPSSITLSKYKVSPEATYSPKTTEHHSSYALLTFFLALAIIMPYVLLILY